MKSSFLIIDIDICEFSKKRKRKEKNHNTMPLTPSQTNPNNTKPTQATTNSYQDSFHSLTSSHLTSSHTYHIFAFTSSQLYTITTHPSSFFPHSAAIICIYIYIPSPISGTSDFCNGNRSRLPLFLSVSFEPEAEAERVFGMHGGELG